MLRGKWWEIFHEPELNALEEQVNINNQNIKQSFENFMSARAQIAEARSQYWPTVTVNPGWSRSKTSGNLTNSTQANAGRTGSIWTFPLEVSWEPDFWGKIRNQVHEEQYAAQVSAADLENERLIEQASLAQYYFEIRGQDALEGILNDTVRRRSKGARTDRDTVTTLAWTTISRWFRREARSRARRLLPSTLVLPARNTSTRLLP